MKLCRPRFPNPIPFSGPSSNLPLRTRVLPDPPARVFRPRSRTQQPLQVADMGYDFGSGDAPVKVMEISDFGCGYCRRFHEETFPTLLDIYVEAGLVEWKFIPFVLGMFPNGLQAATAGECAGEQDMFFRMQDRLFAEQSGWRNSEEPYAFFSRLAEEEGLDAVRFSSCIEGGWRDNQVRANIRLGQQAGARGTPLFLIDGRPISGALPLSDFRDHPGRSPHSTGNHTPAPVKTLPPSSPALGGVLRLERRRHHRMPPVGQTRRASRRPPGKLWGRRSADPSPDSCSATTTVAMTPRIYALDLTGSLRARSPFPARRTGTGKTSPPENVHPETASTSPTSGTTRRSGTKVVLYRIPDTGIYDGSPREAEVFPMILPDGPRDMEALFVLPGEEVFFVSKGRSHAVTLYRYPPPLRPGETVTLEAVQGFTDDRLPIPRQVTGADASADGKTVAHPDLRGVDLLFVGIGTARSPWRGGGSLCGP